MAAKNSKKRSEIKNTSTRHACLIRLELPRWPLRKKYIDNTFLNAKFRGSKKFTEKLLAETLTKVLLDYLLAQQAAKPGEASRETGPEKGSTTPDSLARMSDLPPAKLCWLENVELEICQDAAGNLYCCLCEFYKCEDGSEFKKCISMEPPKQR